MKQSNNTLFDHDLNEGLVKLSAKLKKEVRMQINSKRERLNE